MKQNKAIVVGVTGGVGAGKSTVLNILRDYYDSYYIKADDIGNEVKLKGNSCYYDLISLFGRDILDNNNEIDKTKMAEIIFSNEEILKKVNALIHPAVRKEIEKRIEDNIYEYNYIFIEAALLCEADYFPIINALFEVRADKNVRIQRLMESRDYSLEKCEEIINNQSDESFYGFASNSYMNQAKRIDYYGYYLIENDGNTDLLKKRIDDVMEELNEHIR